MLQKRPPVVVIMGSVDHGKTTLLDYIRKTNVAAKEAGGITQSIGAYEIQRQSSSTKQLERITFIDTPGHEAFSKMRSRGAKIADVAILVVAADDSVKPQTKESIKIIQEAKIPFIVAINKIDKQPEINKVKNDLMLSNVLLEGYGGNISCQPISAKTGQGIDELLDLILLTAEVEDFKYDPDQKAGGFILEAKRDARRGIIASAIIKNGNLKTGDEISAGAASGKIKSLANFLGKKISQAEACAPVLIAGFDSLPKIGEEFFVGKAVPAAAPAKKPALAVPTAETKDKNLLKLILKGDVSGSVEALAEVIKNLPAKDKKIKIIDEGVGDISDGDVQLAISTGAAIVGFHIKITKAAENLARYHEIDIIQSEVIYELIKVIEDKLLTEKEKVSGKLEILATFSRKNKKQVIGGKVTEGDVKLQANLQIIRARENLGKAKVLNLQQNKKDVKRVEAPNECGLMVEAATEIKIGDWLISY